MDSVRIDRWLCAARVYKSRSLASEACAGGKVQVNGKVARSARLVKVGDRIKARAPRGDLVLLVAGLADKRLSVSLARELYQDETPEAPKEPGVFVRERGAGRPTKADRRRLERARGGLPTRPIRLREATVEILEYRFVPSGPRIELAQVTSQSLQIP